MITIYEAQRNSANHTENSTSWFEKRRMKKFEKQIDKEIITAGDLNKTEVEVRFSFKTKYCSDFFHSDSTVLAEIAGERKLERNLELLFIVLSKYDIQGYDVKIDKHIESHQGLFVAYVYDYIVTVTLKWDKDYSNTTLEELEKKYE